MAAATQTVNKQTFYLTIFIVFIVVFISGVGFAVFKLDDSASVAKQNQAEQANVGDQERQAIINLQAQVTANPENFEAWTRLGHLYFDSDQYNKAIEAYTKSLALHQGDANLWTDLGVMYRRSGDPTKAIEAFDQAIAMNRLHEPSRLNKGIVLYYDFGEVDEAIAIWETVLQRNPESRTANGMKLQDFIEQIKQAQP